MQSTACNTENDFSHHAVPLKEQGKEAHMQSEHDIMSHEEETN